MSKYAGKVKLKCPHCGYEEDWGLIGFSPMAAMSKGKVSMWRNGDDEELMDSGAATCDNCAEKFLFKLSVVPTVLTARPPEYK